MKLLRHLLFVLLLLVQTGALTHAVEHLRVDADLPASHGCALCLAAQGLDAPLASVTPGIARFAANCTPTAGLVAPVLSPSVPAPRARAPPAA